MTEKVYFVWDIQPPCPQMLIHSRRWNPDIKDWVDYLRIVEPRKK